MALFVSINIGFITNSSSVVHHFPREMLAHPTISAFMVAMGIEDGFVGDNLWDRGGCTTVAITKEQKEEAWEKLQTESEHCRAPGIDTKGDDIVLIYGDEYESVAASLAGLMGQVAHEMGLSTGGDSYN